MRKPNQGSEDRWRVQTNFVEPKDILRRFSVWPDDILTAACLEGLYSGESSGMAGPFACETKQGMRPLFPFLDAAEGARISGLWETRKRIAYPQLKDALGAFSSYSSMDPVGPSVPPASCVPLILQSLAIFELRGREMELGIWDERTASQKTGTLYAVRPHEAMFTRVEAIPFAENAIVCLPWGGPFSEYSKILGILEDPHTELVLASVDEKMEVVPDAFVLKKMVRAGLIRETRESFIDSRWVLSLPTVSYQQVSQAITALSRAARDVSRAVAEVLPDILALARSGRYSYLEGSGDYIEMAYSVLLGLVFQWAMEDGLVSHPPRFKMVGDGPIVERSRADRRKSACALSGVAIVRSANAAWNDLLATTASHVAEANVVSKSRPSF